jgi:FtsZ-binding cell division protein ZapB
VTRCKCTHPPTTHLGGKGACTVIGCACDEFIAVRHTVSAEAMKLAEDICRTGTTQQAIAAALQNLMDARDSWHREVSTLVAQRDYDQRRASDIESRHAALLDQLRALLGRFDTGAIR